MSKQNTEFYICDLRREFSGNPYITVWRPKNAGYAYPLPWAGKYSRAQVIDGGDYYTNRVGRSLVRFAIPCAVADKLGVQPAPKMVDGNVGPVLPNTAEVRSALRRAALKTAGGEG
ncbi:hypothetical protein BN961_02164 [Afipia felis]|uniref:Uncharacterized protein n=1 Tax=Afipia felis TaxID=1035 RepID=A0A090MMY9_AFIFE|nr:hypothetical protein [Afipia felis]CEG08746.1 hypothetical protein BN961_02164 [Afipia felis]